MAKKSNAQKNTSIAAMGYIFVFWVFPLIKSKNSKFCSFHGRQGFVLFLFEMMIAVFIGILSKIPVLGDGMMMIFTPLALLFFLTVSLVGIWHAFKGERWDMPIISEFTKRLDF